MLPVVFGDGIGTLCIAATSALLAVFSVTIFLFTTISIFYMVLAFVLGAAVMAYSVKLAIDRNVNTAWTLFKVTSPYLTLMFLVLGITIWF